MLLGVDDRISALLFATGGHGYHPQLARLWRSWDAWMMFSTSRHLPHAVLSAAGPAPNFKHSTAPSVNALRPQAGEHSI